MEEEKTGGEEGSVSRSVGILFMITMTTMMMTVMKQNCYFQMSGSLYVY